MTTAFTQLGLRPQLAQTVAELGYSAPTPIQTAVIPVMLSGRDVIGQAQTGTGKTAAFSLPILHNLHPTRDRVQALVVTPTRELAMQVAQAMHRYGVAQRARVLPIYGGQPYARQLRRLGQGVDIVVGTPGRLLDLIHQGALDLGHVMTVVLDEADEMLSMGFIEDIEAILEATPAERQTALFSATLPKPIRRLADRYMNRPQAFSMTRKQLAVEAIEQRRYLVRQRDKLAALTRLFEVEPITRALIFARTRASTGELANELTRRGFPAEALHGDMSQDARERVLRRFREGRITVLVATDVAARGLDIDDISHVFNYDLPQDPEVYVHRIGRTGRAGKPGVAITLLTPNEEWRLRRIEGMMKTRIPQAELPSVEDIQKRRETQLLEEVMVWLRRGRAKRERDLVEMLVSEGYDLMDIAAVTLKMARKEEKQRPIAAIGSVADERPPRAKSTSRAERRKSARNGRNVRRGRRHGRVSHEPGMVRLQFGAGKMHGLRPNDVVGALAYQADIPGRVIGKIFIEEEQSWVDVPQEFVGRVLACNGDFRIGKRSVSVTLPYDKER